jgi:CP family cyanate transporter-like MFS transporter
VGVGPLIDDIQDDLDASHALVGLLGTIPVLCMGLFAPVAAYLSARLGTRRAMTIGLVLIGVFGVLRALAPSAALVVLLTWGVGVGMGLGNALAPLAVRETVPERPATGTGIYTTGIQIGSTVAAAIAVPLAGLLGGWRGALIALSAVACVIAVAWAVLERGGERHVRPGRLFPRLPWGSPTAWLLVAIFGSMGSAYYGLNAWLPDAYGERGWSAGAAGLLLAAMNLTAIPCSFVIPWLSDRHGGRRPWLAGVTLFFAVGAIGLVAMPAAAYFWAMVAGIAQGGGFALVMTLPLDFESTRERVGALVGLMLGVGYSIAAISPFVLGAVRDVTGSFDAVLWVCAGFATLLVVLVNLLPRPHPEPVEA